MPTTFANHATLSYRNCIATSNVVSGVIRDVLTMTKNVVTGPYRGCCTTTYAISIVNSGCTAYHGLTLTDDLGAYVLTQCGQTVTPLTYIPGSIMLYINGVACSGQVTVEDTEPLVIRGLNIPAGGNVLLLYSANINQYAPLGCDACITNIAVLSGEDICDISAQTTTNADTRANLSIIKTMEPACIVENESVTYTFTIQNHGAAPTVASDDVVLRDVFHPSMTVHCVQLNGEQLEEGSGYCYDAQTGQFTTMVGQLIVPAATCSQEAMTGVWRVEPGVSVLTVTGVF